MKSALIYIGVLLSVCACRSEEFPLRTGDLLFQVNEPSEMTEAITDATAPHDRHKISHVAIFQQAGDRRLVIEATGRGGVRKVTLEEFLRSSARIEGRPGVLAMRVRAEFPVGEAIRRAEAHLGEPYDYSYLPDNGRMYSSSSWASRFPKGFRAPTPPTWPRNPCWRRSIATSERHSRSVNRKYSYSVRILVDILPLFSDLFRGRK